MTLDEEIKRCEKVADGQDWLASSYDDGSMGKKLCTECAEEHRQLAHWLKELKALNENDDVKDVFKDCDTCKYKSLEPDDFPCDRCCHRYINQYVYDDKREVNADGRVSN